MSDTDLDLSQLSTEELRALRKRMAAESPPAPPDPYRELLGRLFARFRRSARTAFGLDPDAENSPAAGVVSVAELDVSLCLRAVGERSICGYRLQRVANTVGFQLQKRRLSARWVREV